MAAIYGSEKLPDEIFSLVESFKKYILEQKAYRDQKFDVDPILEVGRDTEEFTLAFQRVAVDSHRNAQLAQQIKEDTSKLLRHSESAYSLLRLQEQQQQQQQQQPRQQQQQQQQQQSQYFAELADQFETRMKAYGEKIKELKMSLDSLAKNYNVDELFNWLTKQHQSLGEIAAKIYVTHDRIMEKIDKSNI